MKPDIDSLIKKEGWHIVYENKEPKIVAFNEKYPYVHPVAIHLKRYRLDKNPELKFMHMKAARDYLWPDIIWHSWTEDRFRAHCEGWTTITYAAGASTTKSFDAAQIAILFYLANPKGRTVVVASTSLESIEARIWGYIGKLLNKMAVAYPINIMSGKPPKVLYNMKSEGKKSKDTIHGMFAVAAREGDDDRTISSWIGRHPDDGLLLILDEATDMPPAILKALPNLESGQETFQCMAIGNSNSKFDLHGAMSTPKDGWGSIDPLKDSQWETNQKNGICMFFSCYNSPAIFETDPSRKEKLSKFLITKEQIDEKIKQLGSTSDSFYRFVLGFWRETSTDNTILSKKFLQDFRILPRAEWSGLRDLNVVAGLDPAFSTGGDACILRLAILGQTTNGTIALDFRDNTLLFKVPIIATSGDSAELQIAKYVVNVLNKYNVPLNNLCVDSNGQGRALSEVIKLYARSMLPPIKIYSTRAGQSVKNSFDVVIRSSYELWSAFRNFIQQNQIYGLDEVATFQLTTRLIVYKDGKAKLEQKNDFKNRIGAILPSMAHSPDEADAASLCLQSAIINYGFTPGQRIDVIKANTFIDEKYKVFEDARKLKQMASAVNKLPPRAKFSGNLVDFASKRRPF